MCFILWGGEGVRLRFRVGVGVFSFLVSFVVGVCFREYFFVGFVNRFNLVEFLLEN